MKRYLAAASLLLAIAIAACGPEEPIENHSCCMYACEGGRTQYFSMYFGSAEACDELARSRCEIEAPDAPGLERLEYMGDVPTDASMPLNAACAAAFSTFSSTTAVP